MTTERLNQSTDRLTNSRKTLLETEELGVSILQDLHQQRQSLLHAHKSVSFYHLDFHFVIHRRPVLKWFSIWYSSSTNSYTYTRYFIISNGFSCAESIWLQAWHILVSLLTNFFFLIQLHGVDDNISKSKKILAAMSKRMSRNKWIVGSLMAALVLAIILILYFKFTH